MLQTAVKGEYPVAATIDLPLEPACQFNAWQTDTAQIDAEIAHVERAMMAIVENSELAPARTAAVYHLTTGGSRTRARLAIASGIGWGTPFRHRVVAAAACELLHNASLVHDDICDADTVRRGHPSVWHLYGRGTALCTGDLLLSSAFLLATTIDDPASSQELVRQLAEQSNRVIGGQSLELVAREKGGTFSVTEYIRVTCAKTAPMLELSLRAGALAASLAAPTARSFRKLSDAIGLAYQILDDLDDMPPTQNANGSQRRPHDLHAWYRHRPGARPSISGSEIRDRCLRHARAALGRAMVLMRGLPEPLETELRGLIRRLMEKADLHAAIYLPNSGDP